MEDLVEKFKKIKYDEKITLIAEDLFGEPTTMRATYKGGLKHNGYISDKYGGWALMSGNGFNIKCYDVLILPYKCKKNRVISLHNIKDVKRGWFM